MQKRMHLVLKVSDHYDLGFAGYNDSDHYDLGFSGYNECHPIFTKNKLVLLPFIVFYFHQPIILLINNSVIIFRYFTHEGRSGSW